MSAEIAGTNWAEVEQVVTAAQAAELDTLLHGRPGTGKTHLSLTLGDPADVQTVTFTELMAMEELRGHWINTPNGFKWHDGPLIAAWRNGTRFVGDELHRASGEVLSFLLAALNDRDVAKMTLPNGETIRPASGFHFIGTTNGHPDDLDPALRDRLLCIPVKVPNPAAIAALPADLRDVAQAAVTTSDDERAMSLRPFFYFAKLRGSLGRDLAGQTVFGPAWGDISDTLAMSAA